MGNVTDKEEHVQILVHLGLTFCQAKVYLALLQSGSSLAKTISNDANIARPDIYRVIHGLVRVGLVEKSMDKPVNFKAIPLQPAISHLLNLRKQETSTIITDSQNLLQEFSESNNKIIHNENMPQFILLPEKEASTRKRQEEIEYAQKSIDFITSWKRFTSWAHKFGEVGKKALERNVRMRVVLEKPPKGISLPEIIQEFMRYPSYEIRFIIDPPPAIIGIFDRTRILIDTSATVGLTEAPTLWSNNSVLLSIVQDFFEIMWVTAMDEIVEIDTSVFPQGRQKIRVKRRER